MQTEAVLKHIDAATQTLPPELSKYISYRRRRRAPSTQPSPIKPVQDAMVAAAAGAAYAAARASTMKHRRALSTGAMVEVVEGVDDAVVIIGDGGDTTRTMTGKDNTGRPVSDVH